MLAAVYAAPIDEEQNEQALISLLSNLLEKEQDKAAVIQYLLSAMVQHDQFTMGRAQQGKFGK